MMARAWRWILATGLLVALLIWVQRAVGWSSVWGAFDRLDAIDFLAVSSLIALGYVARTRRLAAHFGSPLDTRFGRCLRVMVLHNAANNLLPMRTGELSFPLLLRREFGIETPRALAALLWLRLLDLLSLLGVAAATLGIQRWGWPVGALVAVAVLVLPWPLRSLILRGNTAPGGRLERLRSGVPLHPLLATQLWTVAHWLTKLAAYAWILARVGHLPPAASVLGAVAGEMTSVLPIHGVGGAGTYEAGVVLVLKPMGVETGDALIAATGLHLFLLGVSLLAAVLALPFAGRREADRA